MCIRDRLEALKRAVVPSPIKVWLKIDTGMHRLGVSLDEVDDFYQELKKLPQIQPHLGFVSHFSRADELDSNYTPLQLDRFLQATKDKSEARTIAASGGILFWPDAHLDYIRPGIIMYGISPTDTVGAEFGLTPVMNLTSSLLAVRDVYKRQVKGK